MSVHKKLILIIMEVCSQEFDVDYLKTKTDVDYLKTKTKNFSLLASFITHIGTGL